MKKLHRRIGGKFDFRTVQKLLKSKAWVSVLTVDDLQPGKLYIPSRSCGTGITTTHTSSAKFVTNSYQSTGAISTERPFVFIKLAEKNKLAILLPDVGPSELSEANQVYFFDAAMYPERFVVHNFVYTDPLVTDEVGRKLEALPEDMPHELAAEQIRLILDKWFDKQVVTSYEIYLAEDGNLKIDYLTDPTHPWKMFTVYRPELVS